MLHLVRMKETPQMVQTFAQAGCVLPGFPLDIDSMGSSLASDGYFDSLALKAIAKPERFPAILGLPFRIILRLPMAHVYFDDMLKQNGAFEQRFASHSAE